MTIYELSDIARCDLVLTRHHNQGARWTARLERTDTKESATDVCVTAAYGNGSTPEEAIADYVQRLRGRLLVVDAMRETRREMGVPATLEVA